jgi:hypothetical protein
MTAGDNKQWPGTTNNKQQMENGGMMGPGNNGRKTAGKQPRIEECQGIQHSGLRAGKVEQDIFVGVSE